MVEVREQTAHPDDCRNGGYNDDVPGNTDWSTIPEQRMQMGNHKNP